MIKENTISIVPAILENDFAQIEKLVARVRDAQIMTVQIDVCDGHFVPSLTFGSAGCAESFARLAEATQGLAVELDMMIDWDSQITGRFEKWLDAVKISQCQRVVIHHNSTTKWKEIFAQLGTSDIKVGLGVHLDSDMSEIAQLLTDYPFDYVQVMGIARVGFGGQELDERVLTVIANLRKSHPSLEIAVDGGVKLANVAQLVHAGATRLVAGSALFGKEDIAQAVIEMQSAINQINK